MSGWGAVVPKRTAAESGVAGNDPVRAAVLDAALDGIVTIDESGAILEFNAAAEGMFGYRSREVLGQRMVDLLVPPEMRGAHNAGFARYLATGVGTIIGHRVEIEALHRDGTVFPVELAIAKLEIAGKTAFTAYMRDLTERVETHARLVAANKRYRDLVESLPVVVYEAEFGADGAWRYVSPQIEDLLGFPAGDWLTDPSLWLRQMHPDDRDLVLAQEHTLRAKAPGGRAVSEYRMHTRTGETVWVRDEGVVAPADGENAVQMRGVIVDITERKDLEAKLNRHAFYDVLTGLPNRALFMDRLERVIARKPPGSGRFIAVLFIDLDDFKIVNDTLGHAAGDLLLAEMGRRLASSLTPADTPARFGGDEFTILLEDLRGPDEALEIAARIAVKAAEPVRIGDRDVTVTISVGIGAGSGENVRAYDLVSQADIAMYRAKENGKARAELFDEAMGAEAWRRLDLQRGLRDALERRELTVHYQPIVDLTTGEITQVEALVRWLHPERGLLMPPEFIPFAEATGVISQIDQFVLEESCRQLSAWHGRFPWSRQLQMAVNLSPNELRHAELADEVARVLKETGVPASRLTLEITETASLLGSVTVRSVISRLRALGVQLVIDDFGVGYSGLDHFKSFKVHGLKIDRSFVAGLPHRKEDTAIVTAAMAFGRALGLSVVAEGIETEAQLSALSVLGCDRGQGMLLSPPVRPEAIAALLRGRRRLLPQNRKATSVATDPAARNSTRARRTTGPRAAAPPLFG